MAESYFKDPLLAKWAGECFQVKNLGGLFPIEADPISVLLMLDCMPARPAVSGDADRLRKLIRAELSGATRARQEAKRQLQSKPAGFGHYAMGRKAAAKKILEAFDGE